MIRSQLRPPTWRRSAILGWDAGAAVEVCDMDGGSDAGADAVGAPQPVTRSSSHAPNHLVLMDTTVQLLTGK
jgi:hypothetical protein